MRMQGMNILVLPQANILTNGWKLWNQPRQISSILWKCMSLKMVDGFVSPFVSASVHSQSEKRAWGIYHIWQSYRFLSTCLYSFFMKHRIYEKENFWGSIIWRWTSYLAKFEVCPNWDLQRMFDHYSVASTGPFAFTDTLSSRSSTFLLKSIPFSVVLIFTTLLWMH